MNIQEYWPNHPEFKAISVNEVNLIKKRGKFQLGICLLTQQSTTKLEKPNKTKQSFAKHGFVKTKKKKKRTIFYIVTANFWSKIIICFVNDGGKQGFLLYIIGGNVNGTKFEPGNLLLYIKITSVHALEPNIHISKNLFCRYTHPHAEWHIHKAPHCLVVANSKSWK